MRWVVKVLNKIFKNLYIFFAWLSLCLLFVIFVSMSAQYIGDGLSRKILNNKSIQMVFFTNQNEEDNREINKVMTIMKNNPNLKQLKIKIKKDKITDNVSFKKDKTIIILSNDKQLMENLSQKGLLTSLERGMFSKSKQYTKYFQYDEYAQITTNYDDIKLYIGYITNEENNNNKIKIISTFQGLNAILLKQDLEDPNEEKLFE